MSTRFTPVVFVLYKLLAVFAKGKDRLLLLRRNIFNCIVLIFSFPWWSSAAHGCSRTWGCFVQMDQLWKNKIVLGFKPIQFFSCLWAMQNLAFHDGFNGINTTGYLPLCVPRFLHEYQPSLVLSTRGAAGIPVLDSSSPQLWGGSRPGEMVPGFYVVTPHQMNKLQSPQHPQQHLEGKKSNSANPWM